MNTRRASTNNNVTINNPRTITLNILGGLAKILGITQVQVSRIERKTLENMRNKLAI